MQSLRRRRRPVRTAGRFPQEEDLSEVAGELETIQEQMVDLLGQAGRLLRGSVGVNDIVYRRAEGYWMSAIEVALKRQHGNHGVTMEDTINELYEAVGGVVHRGTRRQGG